MNIALDHITLGAASLDQGAAHLRAALGIDIPPGGKHPDMSTHNRLVRVGDRLFLELLAIDPDAPRPARARWFGMDDPGQAARLAQRPRPVGWVVRTDDIEQVHAASPVALGSVFPMSRGARSWRITIPDEGMSQYGGLVPAVIQWSEEPHPSVGMAFLGPMLERVELRHPQADRLRAVLNALGVGDLARVAQDDAGPSMVFVFRLADGSLRALA